VIVVFDFTITVENVVMTGSFSEGVDLGVACLKLAGSKCSWKKFPGLSFKLKSPLATFLLFGNGKFVCTGTKTKTKAEQAITAFLGLLKAEGLVSNQCSFECGVKNLVVSINMAGASVSLEQFNSEFDTIYEPEKFPAAVYKMGESKATFLVFLTGKMICSGVADEEDLKKVVKEFYNQLLEKKIIEKTLDI
jgi:transcription initiation factor TFIID TATA-box-binding protein